MDSDLDEPWIMTVKGSHSIKTQLNPTPESSTSPSKKTQQNGSLHSSKKSSNIESDVNTFYFKIVHQMFKVRPINILFAYIRNYS